MADARAAGYSLREVAERFACSRSTVRDACKRYGVTNDAALSKVSAAHESARERNAARRENLQEESLRRAGEFLQQLGRPHLVFNIGGKDNTYTEHTLDRPPTGDIRNLVTSAATLVKTANDLARLEAERATSGEASALIQRLVAGLDDDGDE